MQCLFPRTECNFVLAWHSSYSRSTLYVASANALGAALRSLRKQPSVGIYRNQTSIAGQDVSIRMSQGQIVPCANMLEQLFQWVRTELIVQRKEYPDTDNTHEKISCLIGGCGPIAGGGSG